MTSPADDSVCVCIAAYNADGTIARAVKSALQQAHVTEVIVVDDASVDGTIAVARNCDDGTGRLTVVGLEQNGCPAAARNRALALSRAGIFCVLDADDYLLPGRIGRLLGAHRGDWDFLADDILIVPEALVGSHEIQVPERPAETALELDLPAFVMSNISVPGRPRAELGFLKPLIRRRFIDAQDLAYDPLLRLGEDYALYVRALMAGAKFKVVEFCGYVAVERGNSLSSAHKAADLAAIQQFDEACGNAPGLGEAERSALSKHRRATIDKWALARALEIRRELGVGAALRFLAGQPRSAHYVATDLLRARSNRFMRHLGRPDAALAPRRLIGGKANVLG